MSYKIEIDGKTYEIKRLSPLVYNRTKKKMKATRPTVPMREQNIAGRVYAQPDYNNDGYQKELAEWDEDVVYEQMRVVVAGGLVSEPPTDFVVDESIYGEGSNAYQERRFLWVTEELGSLKNIIEFIRLVFGLTDADEEDVQEEIAGFRGDS